MIKPHPKSALEREDKMAFSPEELVSQTQHTFESIWLITTVNECYKLKLYVVNVGKLGLQWVHVWKPSAIYKTSKENVSVKFEDQTLTY